MASLTIWLVSGLLLAGNVAQGTACNVAKGSCWGGHVSWCPRLTGTVLGWLRVAKGGRVNIPPGYLLSVLVSDGRIGCQIHCKKRIFI